MIDSPFIAIAVSIITIASPLLIVALGELVVEKSGVLNLGLEGMMLIGAVSAFIVAVHGGGATLAIVVAMIAAAATAAVFAVLTLFFAANQVASGLALTIFGIGASSLIGESYVGQTVALLGSPFPDALAQHSVLRLVFGHNPIVYLSFLLAGGVAFFLNRTRSGLILRAVGENAESAHVLGYRVVAIRFPAILFGGAAAGLGGSYFSLALTPIWADELTSGRGWIALALVVFAAWKPMRLLLGAYLFGAVMTLELHLQAAGMSFVPQETLAAAPYLATILALAVISARRAAGAQAPACLGKTFKPSV